MNENNQVSSKLNSQQESTIDHSHSQDETQLERETQFQLRFKNQSKLTNQRSQSQVEKSQIKISNNSYLLTNTSGEIIIQNQTNSKSQIRQKDLQTEYNSNKQNVSQDQVNLNDSCLVEQQMQDTRQKLISQNKKLKQQLKDFANVMLNIIQKDKDYKTKPKKQQKDLEPAELLQLKKQRARQHQIQINEMKTNIQHLKKILETSYDLNKILEKEEELKQVKKEFNGLVEEKEQLLKQRQIEQSKNVKYYQSEEEYEKQMKVLKEQLKKIKEENKEIAEKIQVKEKSVKKLQDNIQFKEDKIKDMQNKIKERNKILENSQENEVSDEVIADLQNKIKELEAEKKRNDQKFQEELSNLHKEKIDFQQQYEKKLQQSKEKERQLKLSQIKLKEIARLIKSNQNHMLSNTKKTQNQIEEQKQEKAYLEKMIQLRTEQINKLKQEFDEYVGDDEAEKSSPQ
ncbi:hypothetical protein ABPG72_013821 [Tetrahymena utriculariae]